MSGRHRHHIGAPENGSRKVGEGSAVRVLATSNDPVRLSFLTALLADAGIAATVLDAHTSAVEGSIGAIPRRLVVAAEDEWRARQVLKEAGEI
jgi:Putative prokaryotic signal transducing protein